MELKVFIHGAMCYGFSGLCMASVNLTDRSANKGECSQICRTWFENESGEQGFFFSMKDLSSDSATLKELERMGIESLKIEGRMKSPLYVASAAQHYSALLGRTPLQKRDEKKLRTAFSREMSSGWLAGYDKASPSDIRHTPSLITDSYTGHIGIPAGTLLSPMGRNTYQVRLSEEIHLRDGLLILLHRRGRQDEAVQFAAKELKDRKGKSVTALTPGSQVSGSLFIPSSEEEIIGAELRIVSRHDGALRSHEKGRYQPYRASIGLHIIIDEKQVTVEGSFLPPFLSSVPPFTQEIDIQEARTVQKTGERITELFTGSPSPYLTAGDISIENRTALPLHLLFIPSSHLKKIRNGWYANADDIVEKMLETPLQKKPEDPAIGERLPERHLLSPPGNSPLPYADLKRTALSLKKGSPLKETLSQIDGIYYLPLPPLFFDEEKEKEYLRRILESEEKIRVGINNPAHFLWMQEYPQREVFSDIYLYTANRHTARMLLEEVKQIIGGYSWIERECDVRNYPLLMSRAGNQFIPPFFLSRSCYRYDVLGLSCEGCSRNYTYQVAQRDKNYRVDVRECITAVTAETDG